MHQFTTNQVAVIKIFIHQRMNSRLQLCRFAVGDGRSAGQLWVACNDDWSGTFGAGYSDNAGSINIEAYYLNEYLERLADEKEMQEFVDTFGKSIGIESIAHLKEEIAKKSEALFNISSTPEAGETGQKSGS